MSVHSSPFMLDDMATAPSPVLFNSCFNDFDLFDCPVYTPSRPSTPVHAASPRFATAFADQDSTGARRDPKIARRSVHLGGTRTPPHIQRKPVNWARPIRLDVSSVVDKAATDSSAADEPNLTESGVSLRLFGASMQKQRRLNSKAPLARPSTPPSPSPASPLAPRMLTGSLTPSSSSDGSPLLTTPPIDQSSFSPTQGLKGLGVDILGDWSMRGRSSFLAVSDVFASAKLHRSSSSSRGRPSSIASATSSFSSSSWVKEAPREGRVLRSASLVTLETATAPETLAELDVLRKAAATLEQEAKQPLPVGGKVHKIKRKAVPRLLEAERPSSSLSHAQRCPRVSPRLASLPFSVPERGASMTDRAAGRPTPLDLDGHSSSSSRSSSEDESLPRSAASSVSSANSDSELPSTPSDGGFFKMPVGLASQTFLLQADSPHADFSHNFSDLHLVDDLQTSPAKKVPGRMALSRFASRFSK